MSSLNQFTNTLLKFNTTQRITAIDGSVQSSAFQSDTVAVMLTSTSGSSNGADFTIGSNPTATNNHPTLPNANAYNNQTGGGGWLGPIGVTPGDKIAVRRETGKNNTDVCIIELKY